MLGKLWGIVTVVCLIICVLKIIIKWFYKRFILKLSRAYNKKLIETTFTWMKIIEEVHVILAGIAFLSAIIHMIIMNTTVRFSYLGVVSILVLICVILFGVIDKYIYKDKNGDIKICHIIMSGVLFICLFLHWIFT